MAARRPRPPARRRRRRSGGADGAAALGGGGDESRGGTDTSGALRLRHRAVSDAFTAQLTARRAADGSDSAGGGAAAAERPVLVTFEDMARGLHFDAVDAVFILGLPDSPATYLHLAGRTGRQPVLEGSVITISPGKSQEQLFSWSTQLGGIKFEPLAPADDGARGDSEAEEAVEQQEEEVIEEEQGERV